MPGEVKFRGISNLPMGAIVILSVVDFNDAAWKPYSDEVHESVRLDGSFEGKIEAKKNTLFHGNLLLHVVFMPSEARQPDSVLKVVGKKGQNLGGLDNPQVGQMSGENYYLEVIARAYCGER